MYDFRTLSPLDFEELVRDLLQAEFGLRFESFGPGRDLGIDFRFATDNDTTVVQAKHYADSSTSALVRAARKENEKVEKLSPARYLLVTSLPLTPQLKSKLQKAMPAAPLDATDIIGREDLNNLLGLHKEIERKHFKLWLASTTVLERILHSGVYNRTQAEMDIIKSVVPKFVQNESIPQAEDILNKQGALIVAGRPGVGKSTLARMLVWLHAQRDWKIFVIDDIKEAFEVANEGEKRLIFFDDFLGQVRLSTDLVRSVDQTFPSFLQKVKNNPNLRFILTTRDYILRQAQAESGRLGGAAVNTREYLLDVGHYTRAIRAQMLFNHIYFSDISSGEREALLADDFFLEIIDHRNFNPRLIDLLTSAEYVSLANRPIRESVHAVLEDPQELWEIPYRTHISDEGRAMMLALFFNDSRTGIPALERAFGRMTQAMELAIRRPDLPMKFRSALKELEGSVLAIQDRQVRFSNPGIHDFLHGAIIEDRFLPTVVSAVTEFPEVHKAWNFNTGQKADGRENKEVSAEWASAAKRLLGDRSGTSLERLMLFIDLYDYVQSPELLGIVDAAIGELAESEIDGSDAYRCSDAFEQLDLSLAPQDVLDQARLALTVVVAKMLSEYGACLEPYEIRSVGASLFDRGVDEDAAADAFHKATEGYIGNLSSVLSELESLSELEDFEAELELLIDESGISDHSVAQNIESRKEELKEIEDRDQNERYHGWHRDSPKQVSSEYIRSMFAGLKIS